MEFKKYKIYTKEKSNYLNKTIIDIYIFFFSLEHI